ncbi:hypothetical protein ACFWF7_17120 [Nocardia sp. NPDC060256]|uniref:hypothetical protein n=1 Tax=unclassified Nocardia TaxID=2637762 RepID=UPI0036514A9D
MDLPVPIARRDALAGGFTDRELHGVAWQRVRRGSYVTAASGQAVSAEHQHLMLTHAVAGASSAEAVVSHVSAAIVHELSCWALSLGRVHLTRARRSGGRVTRQVALHSMRIDPDEIVRVGGLRVTSVARTVIDLARSVPFEQAVVVGDHALHSGKTTRDELLAELARSAGRPGNPAARRVVAFLDGRSESVGESRSRVALRAAHFPEPTLQAQITTATGKIVARVDFLFPELGVIGEFDGLVKYRGARVGDRPPEDVVIAEKAREDTLRALGWLVVRWTWRDLDSPHNWFARLTRAAEIGRRTERTGGWHVCTDPPYSSQQV